MERFLVRRTPAGTSGASLGAQHGGAGAQHAVAAAPRMPPHQAKSHHELAPQPGDERLLSQLQQYWGYRAFREPQMDVIRAALAGQDNLVVMATGGGKSLCYQVWGGRRMRAQSKRRQASLEAPQPQPHARCRRSCWASPRSSSARSSR
jgi:hypothetical protein